MRITKTIATFCYYAGIDALFYWLNRGAKRILTFHNVMPRELVLEALTANGVSNTCAEFEFIISECAKRFSFSMDLFDPKTITVTFDDGYHNQYAYAYKALKEHNIPAYVFVAGNIEQKPLVVDDLLHWVACAPIDKIPGGNRHDFWVEEVWPKYMADVKTRGESVLRDLDKIYPYAQILGTLSVSYKRERLSGINASERAEMRQAGWLIGWHTWAHYPLSRLKADEVRVELDGPSEFRSVCFSYPFGRPVEVGADAIRFARDLGYPCAVSNCYDVIEKDANYFLPRMALSANKYLLHFELSGAKHFLKTGRLLPGGHHAK